MLKMYLRECKQCEFLFRSTVKTKLCDDCKEINHKKLIEKRKNSPKNGGYEYQRRLKQLIVEKEQWMNR